MIHKMLRTYYFSHPEYLYFDPFGNTCIHDVKSNKCGAFCVSFILSVKNKNDYKKFIAHFNAPLLKHNDKIFKKYFIKILIPV